MEALILNVRKHRVLWDKADIHYKQKRKVDAAWRAVAAEMGFSKEDAKSKWKNLRDTFIRELKKVSPRTGDSSETGLYHGKWAYFDMMTFLIGGTQNIQRPVDWELVNDASQVSEGQNAETSTFSPPSLIVKCEPYLHEAEGEESGETTDTNPAVALPTTTSGLNPPPKKKIRTQEPNEFERTKQAEDYDLDFFKSLIPYMSKLKDKQKLRVRNEIQNIILRELPDE
ncbi:hypothetical protein GE061_011123 [Apolygus lucorum]|uniref:MADF domain-containing protein n=1 Tax=Apolygus lucorum TaxID=248454 RepID=A0A8S9XXR6_APOLU|nr:hypothetical protein GE061_011123 [Apolygus lucorum]